MQKEKKVLPALHKKEGTQVETDFLPNSLKRTL